MPQLVLQCITDSYLYVLLSSRRLSNRKVQTDKVWQKQIVFRRKNSFSSVLDIGNIQVA